MIAWGLQRDSLEDPLFATRGQWHRRAGDSDETPPIDLLLLYCVRMPTVFSRFLVHKSNKNNVQLCSISEQNFSEHSFAVLLFKNSPTDMQFLFRFHRFCRLLNSATAALSSRIDAHTLAGPLGRSACLLSPRCCKPGIKGILRDVKLPAD